MSLTSAGGSLWEAATPEFGSNTIILVKLTKTIPTISLLFRSSFYTICGMRTFKGAISLLNSTCHNFPSNTTVRYMGISDGLVNYLRMSTALSSPYLGKLLDKESKDSTNNYLISRMRGPRVINPMPSVISFRSSFRHSIFCGGAISGDLP